MSQERSEVEGQTSEAEEVLSYWFPDDLADHPHRNQILGRTSTPEELEYLRTETPPHLRQPPSS
jgi:uncharacterized protein (DUF924 family)